MAKVVNLSEKNSSYRLIDILNKLMTQANVNVNQLSKNTGLANTTIKRMCSDPDCNPTLFSINKIADFFAISPNQLIGTEALPGEKTIYEPNFENWEQVPIISYNQAINWPNNIEEIKDSTHTKTILTDLEVNENLFALIATDETLEPKFSEGTVLIFDSIRQPKNKNYVLILNQDKELPQFRQIFIDGPDVYIKTINPLFSEGGPIKLDKDTYRILGVLIQAKANYI